MSGQESGINKLSPEQRDSVRLAILENEVANLKASHNEMRLVSSEMQSSLNDSNTLVKTNNILLESLNNEIKSIKEKSDLIPKTVLVAVIGAAITLGVTLASKNYVAHTETSTTQLSVEDKKELVKLLRDSLQSHGE